MDNYNELLEEFQKNLLFDNPYEWDDDAQTVTISIKDRDKYKYTMGLFNVLAHWEKDKNKEDNNTEKGDKI